MKRDNVSLQDLHKAPVVVPFNAKDEDTREQSPRESIEDCTTKKHVGRLSSEGRQAFHLGRIDFPRFSDDEVDSWIYCCKHYFEIDETP